MIEPRHALGRARADESSNELAITWTSPPIETNRKFFRRRYAPTEQNTCAVRSRTSLGVIDGLHHGFDGGGLLQAAVTHQRPPGEEAERQLHHRALSGTQPGAEHILVGGHVRTEAHLGDLL